MQTTKLVSTVRAMATFVICAGVFGILAHLMGTQAHATTDQALGQAGSAVHLVSGSLDPMTPEQVVAADSACQATLSEVKDRLPMDYGTEWVWAKTNGEWAGKYFPGRDVIALQGDMDCGWVPIVATHEWMHQLQDISGLSDHTKIKGFEKLEIVAECAARVFADTQGWPHYDSYPEKTGVTCSEVSSDVQALLDTI